MGRQLLRKPLTPAPRGLLASSEPLALLTLGLALRQRLYIRITNVIFPGKFSVFVL